MSDAVRISKRKHKIGVLTLEHRNAIEAVLKREGYNYSLEGYEVWIDGTSVRHTELRHGNFGKADNSMTEDTVKAKLPWIISNAEKAEIIKKSDGTLNLSNRYKNSDGTPSPQIRLQKDLNGDTVFVSECVPDSVNKRIYITSAYIKRGGNGQVLNIDEISSPQPTSEMVLDSNTADNSITHLTPKVNTDFKKLFQERLSTPEASELLKKYFADGTAYGDYAPYVEGLKKYRRLAERATALEARIAEADADIVRLRSERRQSGKGTRMDDIYRKRMTAEAQLAECKRRMLEMETRELRHVVESESARAVDELRRSERERYAAMRRERTQNAVKRQYVESIEKRVRDMHEMLLENNAKRHVADNLKKPIEELIGAIDFSSRRSLAGGDVTKKEISLKAIVQSVRELSESKGEEGLPALDLPPRFEAEWNRVTEAVYSLSASELEANGGQMTLENMSVDALRSLNRALADIRHAVSVSDKIISNARGETVGGLAESSVAHMEALVKKKPSDGVLYSFLEWENTLPAYAFDRLGEAGRVLFTSFQDGWDTTVRDISRICEYTSSVYTQDEVRRWSGEVHGFDCTALDGTERKLYLTVPRIMSLYCLLRRENGRALRHVTGGGIVSADVKADVKRYANDARGVRLSADKAKEIVSCLTERQREVADGLQAFMSRECAEWGNEISLKRFGIRAFDENMYFPINTKSSSRDRELMRSTHSTAMYAILNMSFTKPLSERADSQIVIEDIFDVFASHTSAMARMHGLALPMLDYAKWYNYRRRIEAEGTQGFEEINVRDTLANTFGKSGLGYFENFAVSLSGAAHGNDSARIAVRLSKAAKVAMVGFNLRTAAQQPTAAVRALMYLGVGDMSAALKPAAIIRARELAVKYCPMAEWKTMGYFDVGTGRGLSELIRGTDTLKDKTVEASMWLAGKADEYTWAYLWVACEHYTERNEKKLRRGTEEFYEAVGKKLREVIYRTQVVDSPLTKSEYMKSSDGLKQATAMFMAEPTVTYNMMLECKYRADGLKKEGKGTRQVIGVAAKLCGICALQAVLLAGVQSVFDAMRSGSDDEYGEKYLEAFFSNAVSEANPFNKLPIFRDIFSALEGYTVERTDTTLWSKLSYVLKDIQKLLGGGTVTAYKAIYDMLSALSSATGLPISNLLREIVSVWNSTVGEAYPHLKIK